MDIFRVQIH